MLKEGQEQFVCEGCIGDPKLAEQVRKEANPGKCSYCHLIQPGLALEELADRIHQVIEEHFEPIGLDLSSLDDTSPSNDSAPEPWWEFFDDSETVILKTADLGPAITADEKHFRDICQTALEGPASKKLNLDMLVERRARAQERRIVPETISRFLSESAKNASFTLRPVNNQIHTFDPGPTPAPLPRPLTIPPPGTEINKEFIVQTKPPRQPAESMGRSEGLPAEDSTEKRDSRSITLEFDSNSMKVIRITRVKNESEPCPLSHVLYLTGKAAFGPMTATAEVSKRSQAR